jgi:hypothetical protein
MKAFLFNITFTKNKLRFYNFEDIIKNNAYEKVNFFICSYRFI